MRMIVRRTLRQAGFEGLNEMEASNGREALSLVESGSPDLVLCDWNMPEMTGLELLQELKGRGHSVKFGFVTSESTPEMLATAFQAGAHFLITKPFTAEKFQETLDRMLT
jgi:two-component system chemotaxis response regulator CheY